jgi:hypothetical protein
VNLNDCSLGCVRHEWVETQRGQHHCRLCGEDSTSAYERDQLRADLAAARADAERLAGLLVKYGAGWGEVETALAAHEALTK